jgi:hypothetical protein
MLAKPASAAVYYASTQLPLSENVERWQLMLCARVSLNYAVVHWIRVANLARVMRFGMRAKEVLDLHAVDRFVFRHLVDRARAIAGLDQTERRALVDAGQLNARFLVTFEGVREGYERLAGEYEASGRQRDACPPESG